MSSERNQAIVNPAGDLTRKGAYLLAAEADTDLRTVMSEWSKWRAGQACMGRARERIRRVAEAMGARPPGVLANGPPEDAKGAGSKGAA